MDLAGKFIEGDPSECWPWKGTYDRYGYGMFKSQGRSLIAHRVVYTQMVGPIPEGLVIDHLCRNRGCVNPSHMEPVTNAENIRRGKLNRMLSWDVAVRRYAAGESSDALAADFGVTRSTVLRWLHESGAPVRSRGRPRKAA